ncbi:MAG TPA: VTT domain-containing protein, partial [Chthoniobacterales bacterium]|nr:VTT domain-containing protein [Chthoniobacterales bacterium]
GSRGAVAIAGATWLALDAVLPVPSSIVATTMGTALGALPGTVVNAVGLTVSCLIGLLIGRSGSPIAERMLGQAVYGQFIAWVERYGIIAVVACRAVPVMAEVSVIALGAARGRSGPILLAAGIADIGLGGLYAFAGAAHGPAAAPGAPAFAAAIVLPAVATLLVLLWTRRARAG